MLKKFSNNFFILHCAERKYELSAIQKILGFLCYAIGNLENFRRSPTNCTLQDIHKYEYLEN